MKQKKKKSGIKLSPLGGRFFDIKPPKDGSRLPFNTKYKGFWRFFWIALAIFAILNISNIFMRGRDVAVTSQDTAMAGYDYLNKAIASLEKQDLKEANLMFKSAEIKFTELSKDTEHLFLKGDSLFDKGTYLETARKLLESGISVAQIGQKLIVLQKEASDIPRIFVSGYAETAGEIPSLTTIIKEENEKFKEISADTVKIQNNLTTLNSSILPTDLQEKIKKGQEQIASIIAVIREVNLNFQVLLKLLGDNTPHTYLVLFQNNHELRATGGFIGSYMLIDVNDGLITKMEAKDVYESDGQLTEIVLSPPGIDKVSERLFMRDANYSTDFPESAERIMWFLEHSRQPSVDTVIAIDQTLVEGILELTGPLTLEHFPFQIKADNFNKLMSYYIESKISESSTPKQLLFDFIPVFQEKLLSMENLTGLAKLIKEKITSRHIQAYSKDADIQRLIERFDMDGRIIKPENKTDFLSVISTNIGGNKSDEYIKTNIEHHTDITRSGFISDQLAITKTHTWEEKNFDDWKTMIERYGTGEASLETLKFILGGGRNLDYMKIYVPKDSQITAVEGISLEDISVGEELGYTFFEFNFGEVNAGESKTVKISYDLPFILSFFPSDNYKFIAQKQAGAENQILKKTLLADEYLDIIKTFPSSTDWFSIMPIVETAFDRNQIFVTALKKEF
ncbi:DUF4012 domain-containing protein [Candidatus Peregrinibacteria bacterium]|nr:DUF4012 domain-containing protein [Candidatus Peregrinibacteria bacterium]